MRKATDLVCIIDDYGSVRRALGRMISSFGYPIQLFQSAREYLDGPHIEQTTCLVLDITMPEMDGFELHSLLQTSNRSVPTIFISAHDEVTYREQLNSIGNAIFLQKPCEEDQLLNAIKRSACSYPMLINQNS